MRFIFPILAILIIILGIKSILHGLKRRTLARFAIDGYDNVCEIKSSECMIGSSMFCDVRLKDEKALKQHAIVTLDEYGFKLTPTSEESVVYINNYPVKEDAYLTSGDRIKIGNTLLQIAINPAISKKSAAHSDKSLKKYRWLQLLFITVFQLLCAFALLINKTDKITVLSVFGGIIAVEWIYSLIRGFKSNIGVELNAFFLSTVGFCMCAEVGEDVMIKQGVMLLLGFIGFLLLCPLLKNLELTQKLKIPVMAIAVLLLTYNALFGTYLNGAKNWVQLGPISFQPSEIVKVALVFISACSLENMLKMKNLMSFLGFVFFCLLALAYISDFGTALVYFAAMLIILALRLSAIKITVIISAGALLAATAAIKLIPYISARFSLYRHVWEYASSGGYQQTQTMMSISSGGLFGLGLGNGNLHNVSAADTDLVFGMIAEEFGLIFALCVALIFALFVIYAAVCITRTRSIYYAVTSSAASGIFICQAILNIFGSVDLLPLTGVTLPFISNGGSSMIASWMLLAFIKMSGAQFVRINKKSGGAVK